MSGAYLIPTWLDDGDGFGTGVGGRLGQWSDKMFGSSRVNKCGRRLIRRIGTAGVERE
jgi:hypothetical protein